MSKILISGGTGFIGKHLLSILEEKGHSCFVISRKENSSPCTSTNFINFDFLFGSSFSNILQKISPDIFIHLAWDVKSQDFVSNTVNKLWYQRSINLCKQFLDNGGKKIIVAGTCFEYDLSSNDVLNEDSKCIPSSLYGKCKNNLHDDLLYFLDEYNYDLIWARIFYPYGLGEEKRKFISYIIDSIKNDKKLFIKQPNDVLDYIHVSDIAEALSLLTNSNVSGTFNVCSGNQVKVENIIHYIRSKFSKRVDIEYSQNSVSKYIVGNASKITKLGFNCKYDIYKGIDTYFCKD